MRRSETQQACKDTCRAQTIASFPAPGTSLGKRKRVCRGRSSSCDCSKVEGLEDRSPTPPTRRHPQRPRLPTEGRGEETPPLNGLPGGPGLPRGGARVGEGGEAKEWSRAAGGPRSRDGRRGAGSQAGSSPEEKPRQVGDPAAVTMVSARRSVRPSPAGSRCAWRDSNGERGSEPAGTGRGAVRPDGCRVLARPEHLRPAALSGPCRSLCPPSSTAFGGRGWAPAARPAGAPRPRLPR